MSNTYPTQILPSFTLIGQGGPFAGHQFTGSDTQVLIGREQDCQIVLDHPAVSKHHARISNINGQWMIEDFQSSNGTFVNGQRIYQAQTIRSSDVIGLGSLSFGFQEVGGSSARDTMQESWQPAQPQYQPAPPQMPQQPVYQQPV